MDLFLAITLYNDQMFGKCSESILKNSLKLIRNGHTVMPLYNSDLYIDRSRNFCVDLFLKSNCNDLVFIDSDLEFDEDAILKLIEYDKDVVAGAYRYKKSEEEYTVNLDFSRNNNCKEEETGLVYVEKAPTGLMRIKRKVFEDMIKEYEMIPDEQGIYSFFDTGMRYAPEDINWWGEDTYFGKRFKEMGGIIMVAPNINFTHYGTEKFTGNLHEFLMSRALKGLDEESIIDQLAVDIRMYDDEIKLVKLLASRGESIIEIGCWKGNTTKELLKVCDKVCVVDHFNGSPQDISGNLAKRSDIYQEFKDNVGNHPNLTILRGDSIEMSKSLNGDMFDMVFIDAGHEYDEIKADIEAWLPKAKKIISGHDYCDDFPGVKKAVEEKFSSSVKREGSVWWVEL